MMTDNSDRLSKKYAVPFTYKRHGLSLSFADFIPVTVLMFLLNAETALRNIFSYH